MSRWTAEEPQGIGAIVRDDDGRLWVRWWNEFGDVRWDSKDLYPTDWDGICMDLGERTPMEVVQEGLLPGEWDPEAQEYRG